MAHGGENQDELELMIADLNAAQPGLYEENAVLFTISPRQRRMIFV